MFGRPRGLIRQPERRPGDGAGENELVACNALRWEAQETDLVKGTFHSFFGRIVSVGTSSAPEDDS